MCPLWRSALRLQLHPRFNSIEIPTFTTVGLEATSDNLFCHRRLMILKHNIYRLVSIWQCMHNSRPSIFSLDKIPFIRKERLTVAKCLVICSGNNLPGIAINMQARLLETEISVYLHRIHGPLLPMLPSFPSLPLNPN